MQVPAQNDLGSGFAVLFGDFLQKRMIEQLVPPKVEYELSEYGWTLQGILDSLCAWGEKHITKVYGDKFAVLEDSVLNDKLKQDHE